MKTYYQFTCVLFALLSLTRVWSANAASVDVSDVGFTSIAPNPLAPGQHPTSFGYTFDWGDDRTFTAPVGFSFAITLSPNAIFGDADDVSLGTLNTVETLSAFFFNGTNSTTRNASPYISSFQIPMSTLPGQYNAFLTIAPLSPNIDPTPGDAFGILAGKVTISVPTYLEGDWNRDGKVTAGDIPAMLSALTSLNTYALNNSLTSTQLAAIGDFDNSGAVTNRDIQGLLDLVASLGAGSAASVPEPTSLVLLLVGTILSIWLMRASGH
jgi:hypothetical protein